MLDAPTVSARRPATRADDDDGELYLLDPDEVQLIRVALHTLHGVRWLALMTKTEIDRLRELARRFQR